MEPSGSEEPALEKATASGAVPEVGVEVSDKDIVLDYAAEIADNAIVKIGLTPEGLGATRRLADEGIKVNVTLCFSPAQAPPSGGG